VLLKCVLQNDVENTDAGMFSRESLNTTDPLLNDHRVPRQIVINQDIGDLKIDALGAGLCRDDTRRSGGFFQNLAMVSWLR
jgi:hypothetical protein